MQLKKILILISWITILSGCTSSQFQNPDDYEIINLQNLSQIISEKNSIGRRIEVTGNVVLARNTQILYLRDIKSNVDNFDIPCIQLLMPLDIFLKITKAKGIFRGVTTLWGQLQYRPEIADALNRDSNGEIILSINLENNIEVNRIACDNKDIYFYVNYGIRTNSN